MTALALDAVRSRGLEVDHLDTSDHRGAGNVGRLDFGNVIMALRHSVAMWRAIHDRRPALVYLPIAQNTLGFLRDSMFFALAARKRIPVVVHLHGAAFGNFYRGSGRPMRWLIERCLRPTLLGIVLSRSLRDAFGGLVPQECVVEISNGLPQPPRFEFSKPEVSSVHVLYLSNLSPAKGYLDVVEAAARVTSVHPHVRFTIAGEWLGAREETACIESCRRLGLEGRLRFTNAISGLRKAELFRSADVFVFPPRQLEGQPVVLLEAMSYGLPAITTAKGGIVDVVVDGETGMVVPSQNPAALAEALTTLIESPELRARMGAAARSRFEKHFEFGAFEHRLAGVLENSLSAVGQPSAQVAN